MDETRKYAGIIGNNPKIRYPGIDKNFCIGSIDNKLLDKYYLTPGYILVIGNGLPHKNLGVLLQISDKLKIKIVFIGVTSDMQNYWKSQYPNDESIWLEFVDDKDLPSIIRGAFCLAQPSQMEGYGYPPLEAMACGVPSIVSNIPVLLETTGGNSLSANPENPKEWIEAFSALEDANIYQSQRKKGLKWVEPLKGQRGWEKHVADVEELLQNTSN